MSKICEPCGKIKNVSIKEYIQQLIEKGKLNYVLMQTDELGEFICDDKSFPTLHKKYRKKKGYDYKTIREFAGY